MLKQFRTTFGFGVHSPFAYDFIKSVLREKLAYYAYDEMDCEAGAIHEKRLIYRLGLYVENNRDKIAGLAVIDNPKSLKNIWSTVSSNHIVYINLKKIENKKLFLQNLLENQKHGMSFTNPGKRVVLATLDYLPRQDYRLLF
ncbi:MAG: hypothetical protein J1E99_07040 [Muribaculaceae bacterium]|nr:hypothetical protein [Muribaculaceae bacterium]